MPLGGQLGPSESMLGQLRSSMGRDGWSRGKEKCKGCVLSIHLLRAQQTQSLSETLVETSALPVIWTLTKTTNFF